MAFVSEQTDILNSTSDMKEVRPLIDKVGMLVRAIHVLSIQTLLDRALAPFSSTGWIVVAYTPVLTIILLLASALPETLGQFAVMLIVFGSWGLIRLEIEQTFRMKREALRLMEEETHKRDWHDE